MYQPQAGIPGLVSIRLSERALLLGCILALLVPLVIVTEVSAVWVWAGKVTLSQTSNRSPAPVYNPKLGKVLMAYTEASNVYISPRTHIHILFAKATDMNVWQNDTRLNYVADFKGRIESTYDPDDGNTYLAYRDCGTDFAPDCVTAGGAIYVIRSSDGSSWTSPVLVGNWVGSYGPSITYDPINHRLIVAVSVGGRSPYIFQSTDSGTTWSNKGFVTYPCGSGVCSILTLASPEIKFLNGNFWMVFIDSNHSLTVMETDPNHVTSWNSPVTLTDSSNETPAIEYNTSQQTYHLDWTGRDWTGTDSALNDRISVDGVNWGTKYTFSETSSDGPLLILNPVAGDAFPAGALVLGWEGTDTNHSVNVEFYYWTQYCCGCGKNCPT